MNLAIFKNTIKHNYILFIIFGAVLLFYGLVIVGMYDAESMDGIDDLIKTLPQGMIDFFSLSGFTDYTSYLASFFYGMIMVAFPTVYSVLLAYRLLGKKVDNGSISLLLSAPISRKKIIITQIIYGILSVFLLSFIVTAAIIILSESLFLNLLDVGAFLLLNLVVFLANSLIFMTSYFFNVIFDESKNMIAFGAGVPIAFLLLDMLGNTSNKIKFLKYFSIFGYYDPIEIVQGSNNAFLIIIGYVILLAGLIVGSVKIFDKRQLII